MGLPSILIDKCRHEGLLKTERLQNFYAKQKIRRGISKKSSSVEAYLENGSNQITSQPDSSPSNMTRCKYINFFSRSSLPKPFGIFLLGCLLLTLAVEVKCIVVYQVKFNEITTNRSDYAMAGDTIIFTCNYTMKDDQEYVRQVIWSKDGQNFARWNKNVPGVQVLSYTFKGHLNHASTFDKLIIHNVTTAMHGRYVCSMKSELGTHSGERDLVVISTQQCRLNDWRIHSEQTKCREQFRLDCHNMFPKPVQSCGLWDSKANKLIRSLLVDMSEDKPPKFNETSKTVVARETYRLRFSDKYALKFPNGTTNPQYADLLEYAGRLVFKCDILVPHTSWNLTINHKMFDYQDGCNLDPLEAIEKMRIHFSQYAAQRMQQAGYAKSRQITQHADDIEMLTSSLKYEIIAPSHFISGDRNGQLVEVNSSLPDGNNSTKNQQQHARIRNDIDRNCWQRPRIGSFAKLSCASQHNKNQVRLIGANLLECRPSGWIPVKSSVTNLGEPSVVRRQHSAAKKLAAIASSRRPTRDEKQTSTTSSHQGTNDIEDDDDDSLKADQHAYKSSSEIEGPARRPEVSSSDVIEEKIRFENEILIRASDNDNLAPAELAALLPTCISLAPLRPKSRQQNNRLPMIEASSVNNNGKLRTKDGSKNQQDDDNWNWYIFTSTSSSLSSTGYYGFNLLSLTFIIVSSFYMSYNAHVVLSEQMENNCNS